MSDSGGFLTALASFRLKGLARGAPVRVVAGVNSSSGLTRGKLTLFSIRGGSGGGSGQNAHCQQGGETLEIYHFDEVLGGDGDQRLLD